MLNTAPWPAMLQRAEAGRCDVFMKIGGSILDSESATAALIPHVTALAQRHRILVLVGGGQSVKRIKANQKREQTSFYDCWKAGVLCLEVNANLLASYSNIFSVVASVAQISACLAAGRIGVFAPSGAIINSLHLVPDWDVTTDSMGLYFASLLGARRYVIVSDVNGIYATLADKQTSGDPIPQMTAEELENLPTSKLDASFPSYYRRYPLPTIIVNGLHPVRVGSAIDDRPTQGTRIMASSVRPA